MKFWAIAYKYQDGVFYNVETGGNTDFLSEKCLLPCKDLAEQIINDELSASFVPVKIELETLSFKGVYSWARGIVDAWDR